MGIFLARGQSRAWRKGALHCGGAPLTAACAVLARTAGRRDVNSHSAESRAPPARRHRRRGATAGSLDCPSEPAASTLRAGLGICKPSPGRSVADSDTPRAGRLLWCRLHSPPKRLPAIGRRTRIVFVLCVECPTPLTLYYHFLVLFVVHKPIRIVCVCVCFVFV